MPPTPQRGSAKWQVHNAACAVPGTLPPEAVPESAVAPSHDKIKSHLQSRAEKTEPPQQVPSS